MRPPNHMVDDLDYSHSMEDASFWRSVYRKSFPGLRTIRSVRDDMDMQRKGVDRVLTLRGGKQILVDEKCRRTDYDDIALEVRHEHTGGRVRRGWMSKIKSPHMDYLAYAFEPSGRCYLLPFQTLRRVWRDKGEHWLEVHGEIRSRNPKDVLLPLRYWSYSCPVPIPELLNSVTGAMVVNWKTGQQG